MNSNHRMVAPLPNNHTSTKLALLLWLSSSYFYKVRFGGNKNFFNVVMFSFGSLIASFGYTNYLFSNPLGDAIDLNNFNERKH